MSHEFGDQAFRERALKLSPGLRTSAKASCGWRFGGAGQVLTFSPGRHCHAGVSHWPYTRCLEKSNEANGNPLRAATFAAFGGSFPGAVFLSPRNNFDCDEFESVTTREDCLFLRENRKLKNCSRQAWQNHKGGARRFVVCSLSAHENGLGASCAGSDGADHGPFL
jgi:hypothetical protein